MANTIFVRSATKDRKVALSERHELHPSINHEAYVVGYPDLPDGTPDPANVVEVGLTPLVRRKLADGELIEVEAAEAAEANRRQADRQAELDQQAAAGQTDQQRQQAEAMRRADQQAADRAKKEAEEKAKAQPPAEIEQPPADQQRRGRG